MPINHISVLSSLHKKLVFFLFPFFMIRIFVAKTSTKNMLWVTIFLIENMNRKSTFTITFSMVVYQFIKRLFAATIHYISICYDFYEHIHKDHSLVNLIMKLCFKAFANQFQYLLIFFPSLYVDDNS